MPDNNKPATPPPFEPFTVTRNGVDLTFEAIPFKRTKDKNTFFPGIKVNSETLPNVLLWLDDDHKISMIRGKMNQRFQGLFKESCTEADGKTPKPFDKEEFRALAEQFSARGETISEINDEIGELNDELSNMAAAGTLDIANATRIAMRIRQLVLARENKRRTKEDEDAEAATAAAAQ